MDRNERDAHATYQSRDSVGDDLVQDGAEPDPDEFQVDFPDVHVQLSEEDGNVFSIIGRVSKALKRAGYDEAAKEFSREAMNQPSYDAALQLVMRTVETS